MIIPSCAQTYSKRPMTFPIGTPGSLTEASGAKVRGANGRWYIDHVSALGPILLGYNDPDFSIELKHQIDTGLISSSLPHALEYEVADLLGECLPGIETVRYGKNGADVVSAAVKLARHCTGRELIISVGYHGKDDWTIAATHPQSGGIPAAVRALTFAMPYGAIEPIEWLMDSTQVAAVVVEPIPVSEPDFSPDYLARLRSLCTRKGALLIWDEIVTGFRVATGGVAGLFPSHSYEREDVLPDLACYGKAVANGLPLSILVGYDSHMMELEERVFFSTTFGGELLSLRAAKHTLERILDEHIPEQLNARGMDLHKAFADLVAHYRVPAWTVGYGARPVYKFEHPHQRDIFGQTMLAEGHLWNGYTNVQLAHGKNEISAMCLAFAAGLRAAADPT